MFCPTYDIDSPPGVLEGGGDDPSPKCLLALFLSAPHDSVKEYDAENKENLFYVVKGKATAFFDEPTDK